MSFTDLGIPVDAVESRTAAVCTNAEGENRVVIAAKGFVLIVNPVKKECQQLFFPDGYSEYPYETFSSKSGMFYMGAGSMFYEIDPFLPGFTEALKTGKDDELCGFSYAENNQGHIYMASYPYCHLYRYRPHERDILCLGSVDVDQKYPSHMAIDSAGWVYIGTGTTRKNIVAYDPASETFYSLLSDEWRTIGIGIVRQGVAQQAYAQIGEQWVRLECGAVADRLSEDQVPASLYTGSSFGKFHRQLSGDWSITSHSLSDHELTMQHLLTGEVEVVELYYMSEGASLSPIVIGPGDTIYGTSNHPLHFYSYEQDSLINWGSKVIQHGAGGNIAAYAVQGTILAGAAYPGGRLHLYDTSKPLHNSEIFRNPKCVTAHDEIHRPRCAVALSSGEHIIYGGFPGYGMVGGGLCIYHLTTDQEQLIGHMELIPWQSTVSLVETKDNLLIGGTSIETPGGADPQATTACLYTMDWQQQKVMKRWELRDNVREYSLLLIDIQGRIHTMTSDSEYIVWDMTREIVVYAEDLSAWGSVVRQGWELDEEQGCIYGVLSHAVFTIPLNVLQPRLLAVPPQPITSGFTKLNNELYFASSSHLWSYTLTGR